MRNLLFLKHVILNICWNIPWIHSLHIITLILSSQIITLNHYQIILSLLSPPFIIWLQWLYVKFWKKLYVVAAFIFLIRDQEDNGTSISREKSSISKEKSSISWEKSSISREMDSRFTANVQFVPFAFWINRSLLYEIGVFLLNWSFVRLINDSTFFTNSHIP